MVQRCSFVRCLWLAAHEIIVTATSSVIIRDIYLLSLVGYSDDSGSWGAEQQQPRFPSRSWAPFLLISCDIQLLVPSGLDHIRIWREFYIPYLAFYFGNIQYDKIDICMYSAGLLLSTSKQLCAYTHCTFSTRKKQDHPEETASVSVRKNNSVSKISQGKADPLSFAFGSHQLEKAARSLLSLSGAQVTVTLMLSSDERLGCWTWGKPALLPVLAPVQYWCSWTWVSAKPDQRHKHKWKLNFWGRRKRKEKPNFQPDHLPGLAHGCTVVATGEGRGERKISSSDSCLHMGQRKGSVKPLPQTQSVEFSSLAEAAEAQFPTAFGLPL